MFRQVRKIVYQAIQEIRKSEHGRPTLLDFKMLSGFDLAVYFGKWKNKVDCGEKEIQPQNLRTCVYDLFIM